MKVREIRYSLNFLLSIFDKKEGKRFNWMIPVPVPVLVSGNVVKVGSNLDLTKVYYISDTKDIDEIIESMIKADFLELLKKRFFKLLRHILKKDAYDTIKLIGMEFIKIDEKEYEYNSNEYNK